MTRNQIDQQDSHNGNPGKHFFRKMIHAVNSIFNSRNHQLTNYSEVEGIIGMSGVVEMNNHTISQLVDHQHIDILHATNATTNTHALDVHSIHHEKHPADHQPAAHTSHTLHTTQTPHTLHTPHTPHATHDAHHEYQLAEHFARAVEMINTVAGIIVLLSVLLVGYNLLLVLANANLGE